ncbi:hypothetical protein [Parendozoicomonas sp. Alg238-R29]|uniref:hypothetical protein n=1 Tax=Parendozoicomonas sp. Alg238-R29 TaxID=2993446 RepID=UPI00248E445F|nr:hypothetical protein [Parendozoicomonas sp. Alg238-R29]
MIFVRSFPKMTLAPALTISVLFFVPSISAQTEEIKQDEWYASQHGGVVSCYNLSAEVGGSFHLDRYLLIPSGGAKGGSQSFLGAEESATTALQRKGELQRGNIPFYYERYHLDNQFHILNGRLISGSFSQNGSLRGLGKVELCQFVDEKLDNLSQLEHCNSFTAHGVVVDAIGDVNGPGQKGSCEQFVNVPTDTAPLVLIAHDTAKHYRHVYDPMHRLYRHTLFSTIDFGHYNNAGASASIAVAGGSALLTAAALPVALFSAPLALPMAGIGLAGILASTYWLRDYYDSPLQKAQTRSKDLSSERSEVVRNINTARARTETTQRMLFDRYGIQGSSEQLRAYLTDYGQRTDRHRLNTLTERSDLERFRGKLQDAERKLKEINGKDKQIADLNTHLQDIDGRIARVERSLSRDIGFADAPAPSEGLPYPDMPSPGGPVPSAPPLSEVNAENRLPYPEVDRMPLANDPYPYAPPQSVGQVSPPVSKSKVTSTARPEDHHASTKLKRLQGERQEIVSERGRLLRENKNAFYEREQTQGTILHLEQRIQAVRESLDRKDAIFEREVGEPKRLLESYFDAQSLVTVNQNHRDKLDAKISEVTLHKELMALVSQYQNAQCQSR